jgi:hypothetical protein
MLIEGRLALRASQGAANGHGEFFVVYNVFVFVLLTQNMAIANTLA